MLSITFIKMFAEGTNLSLGVVVVRIGAVLVGVGLGVVLLQERLDVRQVIGVLMAILGLALVLFK